MDDTDDTVSVCVSVSEGGSSGDSSGDGGVESACACECECGIGDSVTKGESWNRVVTEAKSVAPKAFRRVPTSAQLFAELTTAGAKGKIWRSRQVTQGECWEQRKLRAAMKVVGSSSDDP